MQPLSALIGHTQSIKCVSFDPHSPCLLASTGYDSSVKYVSCFNTVFGTKINVVL